MFSLRVQQNVTEFLAHCQYFCHLILCRRALSAEFHEHGATCDCKLSWDNAGLLPLSKRWTRFFHVTRPGASIKKRLTCVAAESKNQFPSAMQSPHV